MRRPARPAAATSTSLALLLLGSPAPVSAVVETAAGPRAPNGFGGVGAIGHRHGSARSDWGLHPLDSVLGAERAARDAAWKELQTELESARRFEEVAAARRSPEAIQDFRAAVAAGLGRPGAVGNLSKASILRLPEDRKQQQLQRQEHSFSFKAPPWKLAHPHPRPAAPHAWHADASSTSAFRSLAAVGGSEHDARRLYRWNISTCTSHASCSENEYCMDCKKCNDFHETLSIADQDRWTCYPCDKDEKICESAAFCSFAMDSVDGTCPTDLPGCDSHSECRDNEYCFSCEACLAKGLKPEDCAPCPTQKGGFCRVIDWCIARQDAIDGGCPQATGCQAHTDCAEDQYCEDCTKCKEIESQRSGWWCGPCPTVGNGFCSPLRFCQLAQDGIDGDCPMVGGCDHHVDCKSDEYCMSCGKCATYHSSLPPEKYNSWTCDPCPAQRGGICELRQFCAIADDSIDDTCPDYEGCDVHSDCRAGSFCLKWSQCVAELGEADCGTAPNQQGICTGQQYCTPARSIDARCEGNSPCRSHRDCNSDLGLLTHFCTPWFSCMETSPDLCGRKSIHADGVCLRLEHCARGLHAPVDGGCPIQKDGTMAGELEVADALRMDGAQELTIESQSMNIWSVESNERLEDGEYLLSHVYNIGAGTRHDDDESAHLSIFKANEAGVFLSQDSTVDLSCPHLVLSVPDSPRFVYEARIAADEFALSVSHLECSCIEGESVGACPRTVAAALPGGWAPPPGAPAPGQGLEKQRRCNTFAFVDQALSLIDSGFQTFFFLSPDEASDLVACSGGSVQMETDITFKIAPTANQMLGFALPIDCIKVTYYRLDVRRKETFTCKKDCHLLELSFDSSGSLTCTVENPDPSDPKCGFLPENKAVKAVPLEIMIHDNLVSSYSRQGSSFCAYCLKALQRMYPVLFLKDGQPQPNELTVYTLDREIRAQARLVDSSLAGGAGDPELGCPYLVNQNDVGNSMSALVSQGRNFQSNVYLNKWCVVQVGGCPMSDKYKMCITGGAKGVLFMDPPPVQGDASPQEAKAALIHLLRDDSLTQMVPAAYAAYDEELFSALKKQQGPLDNFTGVFVRSWMEGEVSITVSDSTATFSTDADDDWDGASGTVSGGKVTIFEPQALKDYELILGAANLNDHAVHLEIAFAGVPDAAGRKLFRQEPILAAGPLVGRSSRHGEAVSKGGLRVYDVSTEQWHEYTGAFGGVHWLMHSPARPVLFVCTAENRLLVMDTAFPESDVRNIGQAGPDVLCLKGAGYRNHHVVDFLQDGRFYTAVIDMNIGNRIAFYDTTRPSAWTFVAEVFTSWETNQELGNVVPTPDGERLLITWYCPETNCNAQSSNAYEGNLQPGERLYVLDVGKLSEGRKPTIGGIIQLDMSEGSRIRDVACSTDDLCLVSMNHDGVVVIDISPGLHRYQVIARHSDTFASPQILGRVPFFKSLVGAQKVYASKSDAKRFYVEKWVFDSNADSDDAFRHDRILAVSLTGYSRPPPEDLHGALEQVEALLYLLGGPLEAILSDLPAQTETFLEQVLQVTVTNALHVEADRVTITEISRFSSSEVSSQNGMTSASASVGVKVKLELLPGDGAPPAPLRMFEMLKQQVQTSNSALRRGMLGRWFANARLVQLGEKNDASNAPTTRFVFSDVSENRGVLGFMALVLLALVLTTTGALVYASSQRLKAKFAQDEMARMRTLYMQESGLTGGSARGGPGDVIGRPASELGGGGGGSAGSAFVVGTPMSGGAPSQGNGVVGGTALSQAEAAKFSTGGAASSSTPDAGAANRGSVATAGGGAVAGISSVATEASRASALSRMETDGFGDDPGPSLARASQNSLGSFGPRASTSSGSPTAGAAGEATSSSPVGTRWPQRATTSSSWPARNETEEEVQGGADAGTGAGGASEPPASSMRRSM